MISTPATVNKDAEDALLKTGALQNAIFNSANFSSIATDEKGVIQIFNVGAERMLGYTAAEVMNTITPADISDPQEVIARAKALSVELGALIAPGFEALVFKAARGIEDIYELTYIRKDGSRFPAVVSVTALRDAQNAIIGYLLIGTDNTARKQASEYARSLLEASLDPLVTISAEGKITDVNEGSIKVTGVAREKLIGTDFSDYFTEPERAREGYRQVFAKGFVTDYPLTIQHKDGRLTDVLYNASLYKDASGNVLGVFAAARDITERKQASEYARSLLEASLDPLVTISAEGKITDVNEGSIKVTGVAREKLIGTDFSDYFTEPERAREGYQQVFAKGFVTDYPLTIQHRNGRLTDVLYNASLYKDASGNVLGVFAAARDITERKQAEAALLKASALQNAIFNSANFSSIATDEKGVIQIFNVGAERMLGYTAAEVMNTITPADISDPPEVIARAKALSVELGTLITPGFEALVFKAARGIEDIYELTYIRKDGSRFPAVVSVTALRDAQDAIIGYLLIGTDNTARKQVEAERMRLDQAVRDQQFYTRSLIESNIDALMTTDPHGIITDVNKQMEALTGCARDELIGAPFKDYFTDPERAEAGIKLVLGEGKVTDYELTAHARDGKETVVSYNATTFHDRDRKLRGVFAAARDVTERKRYEQSLQEADRHKNEFLALLAHELRNPLAPISNAVQVLRFKGGSQQVVQSASVMIERQVGQMVRLVDDLLDVSRISRGKIELRKERIELVFAVNHAAEAIRPNCESMDHELTLVLPPNPIFLNADPTRLAQILGNLLTNACKFTVKGGRIFLTVEREGVQAVIRVRDTGIGIAADQFTRIFDMFTQLDTSLERSVSGLGIGLTLVKNLVELHGGTVGAHSAGNGHGSEFTVRLPVLAGTLKLAPPAPSVSEPTPTTARRILVVDDNQDSATTLAMLLEVSGHEVHTANDGLEAVEAAGTFRPHVVLLDIGLPNLNGYEAARQIREQPWGKDMVLVALTGWGQEESRQKSRDAGFNGHLTKPVDFPSLAKSIAEFASVPWKVC